MIFSTQNQVNCFLISIFCGIIAGLFLNIISTVFLENFQKKLIKTILNTIFYAFFSVIFVFFINFFNFGKFSITIFISYVFGFLWSKSLLRKTVVILQKLWYNKLKSIQTTFSKAKDKKKKNEKSVQN